MQSDHQACDTFFMMCLNYGLKFMIEEGIQCGSIENEQEGIEHVKGIIHAFEILEHYEKCEMLNRMILEYYDIKKAA
jgi:hypothetical protein